MVFQLQSIAMQMSSSLAHDIAQNMHQWCAENKIVSKTIIILLQWDFSRGSKNAVSSPFLYILSLKTASRCDAYGYFYAVFFLAWAKPVQSPAPWLLAWFLVWSSWILILTVTAMTISNTSQHNKITHYSYHKYAQYWNIFLRRRFWSRQSTSLSVASRSLCTRRQGLIWAVHS